MKSVLSIVLVLSLSLVFVGCGNKVPPRPTQYAPLGTLHSSNFGGVRKLCVDDVMYITSYNGLTPAIDSKTGKYLKCSVDEYGRVIVLGTFKD